jgi:hypothetical protein
MLQGLQTPLAWGETWQSMWVLERQQCHRDTALRGAHLLPAARLAKALALNPIGERDENCARVEPLLVISSSDERRVR